jgi:hypothetical protein
MTYEESAYCASDYAGMATKEYSFYYGYEQTIGEDWAFVASDKHGKELFRKAINQSAIDFDCTRGLLAGIAYFLDHQAKGMRASLPLDRRPEPIARRAAGRNARSHRPSLCNRGRIPFAFPVQPQTTILMKYRTGVRYY